MVHYPSIKLYDLKLQNVGGDSVHNRNALRQIVIKKLWEEVPGSVLELFWPRHVKRRDRQHIGFYPEVLSYELVEGLEENKKYHYLADAR